jgi:hypothetical protein
MASTQDASIGVAVESVYKTGVTPATFYEHVDESLDWNKTIVQGAGLRVGSRVARSGRRVIPTADGGGDFTVECISKSMGKLWQACLGSGTATLVSGSTYQHNFLLADTPSSLTIQKGLPEVGGTVDAYTFLGCMVDSWEFDFPNAGVPTLKVTVDAGDLTIATGYAAPSYPSSPNLFNFANATLSTGTLTSPTATALASAVTPVADVRGGTLQVNNNVRDDRFNIGGGGRKAKPTMGLRDISGTLEIEYDNTTFRDAVLNDTPMSLVLTYTAGALSTGNETLQVVLPEIKFDGALPMTNGTDLITQSMSFKVLDNLTAAQPIWVVMRSADTTV